MVDKTQYQRLRGGEERERERERERGGMEEMDTLSGWNACEAPNTGGGVGG